jgi:hypothetical protein
VVVAAVRMAVEALALVVIEHPQELRAAIALLNRL